MTRFPRLLLSTAIAAAAIATLAAMALALGGSDGAPEAGERAAVTASPAPEATLAGRAVAATLPSGEHVTATREVRNDASRYDLVDARRADGSGYEVNVWYRFAPDELAAAGVSPVATEQGRLWPASDDPALQSIYFQSRTGVAVRVAHHSTGPADRADRRQLVAFAERLTEELANANGGVPPAAETVP